MAVMRRKDFKEWLVRSRVTPDAASTRASSVLRIEKTLPDLGMPYKDLDEAWNDDKFVSIRERIMKITKDFPTGGQDYLILMPEAKKDPRKRLRNWGRWLEQYGKFLEEESQTTTISHAHIGADQIRKYALYKFINPGRMAGKKHVDIRVRDVAKGLNLVNRYPRICSALNGQAFKVKADISRHEVISDVEPSSTTVYRFFLLEQDANDVEYPTDDIWDRGYDVIFTSFWGWSPAAWGGIGWTGKAGRTRRDNLIKDELSDPFIAVCYVTQSVPRDVIEDDPSIRGHVAGFYLVSHETCHRNDISDHTRHQTNVGKWEHSLRALRAFSYLPEHRINAKEIYTGMKNSPRGIAGHGEILEDPAKINRLRNTPWQEVPIFRPSSGLHSNINSEDSKPENKPRGKVRPGPASRGEYVVSGGTEWKDCELYILRLDGDIDAYLGNPAAGRLIIKIGVSSSPDSRRLQFQNAIPKGTFKWKIHRRTTENGLACYPNRSVAVDGENAMKEYLSTAQGVKWLNGEFYLADEKDIKKAWQKGRDAAEKSQNNDNRA